MSIDNGFFIFYETQVPSVSATRYGQFFDSEFNKYNPLQCTNPSYPQCVMGVCTPPCTTSSQCPGRFTCQVSQQKCMLSEIKLNLTMQQWPSCLPWNVSTNLSASDLVDAPAVPNITWSLVYTNDTTSAKSLLTTYLATQNGFDLRIPKLLTTDEYVYLFQASFTNLNGEIIKSPPVLLVSRVINFKMSAKDPSGFFYIDRDYRVEPVFDFYPCPPLKATFISNGYTLSGMSNVNDYIVPGTVFELFFPACTVT